MRGLIIFIWTMAVSLYGAAQQKTMTYLALGDSYTIGEAVPAKENFPNQLADMLRAKGRKVADPVIIAKTGWTTADLQKAINEATLNPPYDLVTLLIGVNNQYQNKPAEEYAVQFESLLKQAIQFAGGNRKNVVVVSIPDWGATPFARDRDRALITEQITDFNLRNSRITAKYEIRYVDITEGTREALINPELVASDKLHPSGLEYKKWAEAIVKVLGNGL